jgi:hypothetical protein
MSTVDQFHRAVSALYGHQVGLQMEPNSLQTNGAAVPAHAKITHPLQCACIHIDSKSLGGQAAIPILVLMLPYRHEP